MRRNMPSLGVMCSWEGVREVWKESAVTVGEAWGKGGWEGCLRGGGGGGDVKATVL